MASTTKGDGPPILVAGREEMSVLLPKGTEARLQPAPWGPFVDSSGEKVSERITKPRKTRDKSRDRTFILPQLI